MRLDLACLMTPSATVSSPTGTFHSSAAACSSMMRAAAPPLRTYSCEPRMPRLPPVDMSPHTRLRARFCPGVGYSHFTLFQSHSSSSQTSWARPVSVPWPISERAMRTITSSLGLMNTQAPTSLPCVPSTPCASASPSPGTLTPRARPPPAAAPDTRNLRRETFVFVAALVMASLLSLCCRLQRRRACRPPPCEWPRERAGRCRSGRCWSSPDRYRHRSASASS